MIYIRSCKDCTERTIGCHANCEKYLAEKAAAEEERMRRRTEIDRELAQVGRLVASFKRMRRRKH